MSQTFKKYIKIFYFGLKSEELFQEEGDTYKRISFLNVKIDEHLIFKLFSPLCHL